MTFLLENAFIIAIAVVSGAMLAWPAFSRTRGGKGVDTLVATQMVNQQHAVFVDVRSADEYAAGHIAQARNVPIEQIDAKVQGLPKNKPLIVVCANGRNAGRAAAQLQAKGFENVVTLTGGMTAWQQAGLPTTKR